MPAPNTSFQPWLSPRERIVWTGRPRQGLVFTDRDALLIPFSLLWTGFVVFWNAMVWIMPDAHHADGWVFRLWGLPFLVVGVYFVVGRFVHDAVVRRSILYAVTDQRILVLRGARSPKLTSLDIHRLPKLELSEHRDGTGTIAFDGENALFSVGRNGMGTWVPALGLATRFFCIDNVRSVYALIQERSRG